jgi:type II secretory pathway component PulF
MTQPTDPAMTFAYQAQTLDGAAISGTIDAPSPEEATRLLTNLRLRVLQLDPVNRPARAKPLRGEDFLAFNQQLTHLTAAGLPVEHGLKLIARDMRSGRLSRTISDVATELERGTPLGEAFDKYQNRFPPLYGKLVAAGVRTNNLSGMLLNLGRHAELVSQLRATLWRAIAYPTLVLAALGVVLIFLGIVVIPQFGALYKGFGVQLPGATMALLASARWIPWIVGTLLALVVLSPLIWQLIRIIGIDRQVVDHVALPLPLVGPVLERNMVARWCDAVRLAVQAGMNLPAAIELAGDAVGSPRLRADGQKLIESLKQGRPLDQSDPTKILPPTVATVLSLASQQHDLPSMLDNLSTMYQQQAQTRLALIPGLLTPVLIIMIAVIIGAVVAALFLPFISLIRAITG